MAMSIRSASAGAAVEHYRADLSYLGTYAADRQAALLELLVGPASLSPARRFLIAVPNIRKKFPGARISISSATCRDGASGILFILPADPERHAARHGRDGWCPRAPVRGGGMRAAIISDVWPGSLPSSRRAPKSCCE